MTNRSKLLAVSMCALFIGTAGHAQSADEAAERAQTERGQAAIAEQQAQLKMAANQYRSLIIAKEAGRQCSALSVIALAAANLGARDLRSSLITYQAISAEQADQMEADTKSGITEALCDDLLANAGVTATFDFANYKANEYLTIWDYYFDAATANSVYGGDYEDYDCGIFHPIREMDVIRNQTKAARAAIAGLAEGPSILSTAEQQANRLHNACQQDPDRLLGNPMMMIMSVAQGIAIEAAQAE